MNKDDFWSVDRLLPRIHSSFSDSVSSDKGGVPLATLDHAVPDKSFGEPVKPSGSRVIRFYRLTEAVFPQNDLILQSAGEKEFPFAPCPLFSPTMLSLTKEQRNYFFFFCSQVKKRNKVETSFAYLRLYLCRLLREIEISREVPEEIFWLWETYREEFPLADKLFADTVSDYCFYKRISLPFERLGVILTKKSFTIRPFLLDPYIFDHLFREDHKLTPDEINYLLRTITSESFRKSKAYRVNARFAATAEKAVQRAFSDGLFNRKDLNESLFRIQIPSEVHTVRKLFLGLPAEEVPQVEINLCYLPLLHDENIRYRCDEIVRYLENRIRAILKIKNSLSRIHIGNKHKAFLEGILLEFAHLAPEKNEVPQEKDKDAPRMVRELVIDPGEAKKIEANSWTLTQRLTEAYLEDSGESITIGGEKDADFDKAYDADLKKAERKAAAIDSNEFWEFAALLSAEEDRFMCCAIHSGKAAARNYSTSLGMFYEAMIASCNAKAVDAIGDAVMDPSGDIFDEYRSDLKEVFPEMKGEKV